MPSQPIARSFLFVPGDRSERFSKAIQSGADELILDLEDAVADEKKVDARDAISAYLNTGAQVLLRINSLLSRHFLKDLSLCRLSGVKGVVLPKTESAADIIQLQENLSLKLPIYPLIETAKGMLAAHDIAGANGVARLMFGTIDFSVDLNLDCGVSGYAPYWAQLVMASRANDLQPPIDGVTVNLQDQALLQADTLHAKRAGMGGKLCIHPLQIQTVNACFVPSAEALNWAENVIQLSKEKTGAFAHEGKMVDEPILLKARQLLLRARQSSSKLY